MSVKWILFISFFSKLKSRGLMIQILASLIKFNLYYMLDQITPYNAQVNALKTKFETLNENIEKIEINTVDGFQGREKMVIIISMVRSNKERQVGFLNDYRRMNVAITRAQRLVCLVGDSETVQSDQFLFHLVEYFIEHGEIHSALELWGDPEIRFGMGNDSVKQKPIKIKKENKKKLKNQKQQQQKSEEAKEFNEQKILEQNQRLSEFEIRIQKFINSNDKEMQIEGLNSFERLKVHEIAEKYQLTHQSIGDGAIKTIVLGKFKKEKKVKTIETKEISEEYQKNKEADTQQVFQKSQENLIKPQKPKRKKQKAKEQQKQEDLDDDAYLDALIAQNEVCNFGRAINSDTNIVVNSEEVKCAAKVKLLGQTCPYCHLRYCLRHAIPEVHGCAEAAQRAAKQKVIYIADQKERKQNEAASDYLKKKLQKKIEKKVEDRKAKKPKKNQK